MNKTEVNANSEKIFIIGAGGLGLMTVNILIDNQIDIKNIAFIDDNENLINKNKHTIPVHGPIETFLDNLSSNELQHYKFIIAVGNTNLRRRISAKYSNLNFINAIHPTAIISPFSKMGTGNIILPGAIIDPEVEIGSHVTINKTATIGHNTLLEDYSQISPGVNIGGYVHIQEGVFIGLGAAILPHVVIGSNSILGAGSTAVKNIPANCTAVGSPAKPIKSNLSLNAITS